MYKVDSTDLYILSALHKLLLSSQLRSALVSLMLAKRLTAGFSLRHESKLDPVLQ